MKNILITSTDLMMIQFLIPHVIYLSKNGYEVTIACSNVGNRMEEIKQKIGNKIGFREVRLCRKPLKLGNLKGYKDLKDLIENGNFDLIWTNEPVMGVMTRLAAIGERKKGCSVLYVAHGFHFYKGASWLKWALFCPIEKWMSRYTDQIITINEEDYRFAEKHFREANVVKYPGIGVDTTKFKSTSVYKKNKCDALGIPYDKTIFISVGELEKRKNHETTIQAFAKADMQDAILIICGVGSHEEKLRQMILNMNLLNKVYLLGYRHDIAELLSISDVFVFSTFQEGLSVALMEAMSNEILCAVSKIRGNVDLIEKGKGIYFNPNSVESCKEALLLAKEKIGKVSSILAYNKEKVQQFDLRYVRMRLLKTINILMD
ncbi:glycosyltransferase [Congzhengia minquanensis]|uniref:Glycosyltransferase n=1 Tax=Congzhengia minquanensis TaxID=2763657 RepID=A0A926DKJ4_9FIRM|nr:glycosyltransferase [Congzhengia minquanensis]MBC8539424.1 glycosyltransferase [Congzhengia minquanensis]